MSNFELYLHSKKIDPRAFRDGLPEEFDLYFRQFEQSSAAAFDLQKKFFLNNLRLEFPLTETPVDPLATTPAKPKRPRPKMK